MIFKKHKPYNKLKGIIREKGLTYKDVAKELKISETALSHKINGKSDFYVSEIEKLENAYGLNYSIFFTF